MGTGMSYGNEASLWRFLTRNELHGNCQALRGYWSIPLCRILSSILYFIGALEEVNT